MTTEYPPQSILDPPPGHVGRPPVEDETGSNSSQIVVAVVSLSIAFLFIFVVFIIIFLRKCKKNRKIYIPVTPNFNRSPNSTKEHTKHEESQRHGNMSGIFESLVAVGRETDDEYGDEMNEIHCINSHSDDINIESFLKCKGNSTSPATFVPSRNGESKHSRSLPSLKHLSAHEEALSYLALGHNQGPSNSPQQIKPQTSSGVFGINENGFIRSRSFNERIAFGLNISRQSVSNRNRINVTALNRCMTTAADNDAKLKLKCKESVKSRKQKNVRGSFIKSMRISNLVEIIPTHFNFRKKIGNSVSRYRKSLESSRTPPTITSLENCPAFKTTSFCTSKMNPNGMPKTMAHLHHHLEQPHFGISPSLNSDKLPKNPSITNFLEDFNSSNSFAGSRNNGFRRSKSCIVLAIPTRTSKTNHVALRSGNAISFDQLEEYSKKFMG